MDPFTQKNEASTTESSLEKAIEAWSQRALDQGKNLGLSLDYSIESLRDLDKIMGLFHQEQEKTGPSQDKSRVLSLIFGAYLGQVLAKNHPDQGYFWTRLQDREAPILKKGQAYIDPIKRIEDRIDKGQEANLVDWAKKFW